MKQIIGFGVVFLFLLSSQADAKTLEQVVKKYGIYAVKEVIANRTGGELTIYIDGSYTTALRPSSEYITLTTLSADMRKTGLSADRIEKEILDRQARAKQEAEKQKQLKEKLRKLEQERKEKFSKNLAAEIATQKPPAHYRSAIKNRLNDMLFDPYSVRDLRIGSPVQFYLKKSLAGIEPGKVMYIVNVSLNAKNRFGGYVGKTHYKFLFRGERIVEVYKDE